MELQEIISSSLSTIEDKREVSHAMSQALSSVAKGSDIDSAVLRRVKDYSYYKGMAWLGTPLELDKDEKFKDRLTPTFKKLLTIVDDLAQVGKLSLLDEYLDALKTYGIAIDLSKFVPQAKATDLASCDAVISSSMAMQKEICEMSDQIRETDAEAAEAAGFGPKSEYNKLVNLAYAKSRKGKDVSEKCDDEYAKHELSAKSYKAVSVNEF